MDLTVTQPKDIHPDTATETAVPYFRAPESPLSLLHPDLAAETARFLALEAGRTIADQGLLDGDPLFLAEVAGVMAILEASG